MHNKHQVHNLIILDESGSMQSIKNTIIQGFNELVQTMQGIQKQFPEQEHYISFVSFNGLGQKMLHFLDPIIKLQNINDKGYFPEASTPLFDAMGSGIHTLKRALTGHSDYNVLVTILTDGEENASKEFTGKDIKKLVEELTQNRWTFTYIGTDHDVEKMAASISIRNIMSFDKNETGISTVFLKEKSARNNYSAKIRSGKNTDTDYFEEEDK